MASIQVESKTEEKNDLQLVCTNIECKCGECSVSNGDEIYACKNEQCALEYYCEDCGPYYHQRKKSNKNHVFDPVSIQELLQMEPDSAEFIQGTNTIKSLIGTEKYNKMKAYFEKPVSLALENIPMSITLAFELSQFLQAAELAVQSSNAAITATNVASKTVVAAQKAISFMAVAAVLSDFALPPPFGDIAGQFYLWAELNLKNKEEVAAAAKAFEKIKAAEAANALNAPLAMKDVLKSGAIGCGLATTIEMGIHAYRYANNEISGLEWIRLSGKAFVRNGFSLVGSAIGGNIGANIGCKIGVGIGTTISPGLGTAVGAGIGIFSGLLLGYLMGKGAEYIYEQYFPSQEEVARKKLLLEALNYFHLQEKDIDNEAIFNDKALHKLFRKYSLDCHPDRRGGDHSEWHRLSAYYGILKGYLSQNKSNKKIVKEAICVKSL